MNSFSDKVKVASGQEWEYTMELPSSIEEAIEIFGADGAITLLNSGLKVKKQAIARELFKASKTVEEVEAKVHEYRPGAGNKRNQAMIATELIMSSGDKLALDPILKKEIITLMAKKDFGEVIKKLGGKVEEVDDGEVTE
jgi:hypothetical protein